MADEQETSDTEDQITDTSSNRNNEEDIQTADDNTEHNKENGAMAVDNPAGGSEEEENTYCEGINAEAQTTSMMEQGTDVSEKTGKI